MTFKNYKEAIEFLEEIYFDLMSSGAEENTYKERIENFYKKSQGISFPGNDQANQLIGAVNGRYVEITKTLINLGFDPFLIPDGSSKNAFITMIEQSLDPDDPRTSENGSKDNEMLLYILENAKDIRAKLNVNSMENFDAAYDAFLELLRDKTSSALDLRRIHMVDNRNTDFRKYENPFTLFEELIVAGKDKFPKIAGTISEEQRDNVIFKQNAKQQHLFLKNHLLGRLSPQHYSSLGSKNDVFHIPSGSEDGKTLNEKIDEQNRHLDNLVSTPAKSSDRKVGISSEKSSPDSNEKAPLTETIKPQRKGKSGEHSSKVHLFPSRSKPEDHPHATYKAHATNKAHDGYDSINKAHAANKDHDDYDSIDVIVGGAGFDDGRVSETSTPERVERPRSTPTRPETESFFARFCNFFSGGSR